MIELKSSFKIIMLLRDRSLFMAGGGTEEKKVG
jgi:hypothetical protein